MVRFHAVDVRRNSCGNRQGTYAANYRRSHDEKYACKPQLNRGDQLHPLPSAIILLFDMMGVSQDFWPLPISPNIVGPAAFLLLPVALIVGGAPIKLPAIIGFFFVLPFLILEFVTRSNLPRSNASIVLFVFMWLLSTAFIAILMLIMRNVRTGNNILAKPVFLLFSGVFLVSIAWQWGALVIDQMPCFLGGNGC
jgi:hypothetical protein